MEPQNPLEQKKLDEDPPLFFINPITSNICITKTGLIIDVCHGKGIGLWDPVSGKCVKLFQNIITGVYYKLNYLSQIDKIIISDEKCLKLFDYTTESIIKTIPINMFLDEIMDHIDPTNLIGINSGVIYLWSMETGQLLRKINTGSKAKSVIRLENGNYLVRNNEGDIYAILPDLSISQLINTQGAVYSFCRLQNNEYALGRNQSIHIMEGDQNSICSILKGFDEVYVSLLDFGDGKIISGSNKANLRLWDIKTAKCLKLFGKKEDLKYLELYLIPNTTKIISTNNESKRIRTWDIGKIEENTDPISLKLIEGELSNIQKIVKLDEQHIGILCFAQYFDGQLIFLQEIRIFNFITNSYINKKQINRGQYIVDASSMISLCDGKVLLYLTKGATIEKDVLHLWEYETDIDRIYDFNIEKSPNVYFSKFERIIVPFSISFCYIPPPPPGNLVSNVERKGVNIKGPSGINVYDFLVKSIFKIEFDVEFLVNAAEMLDSDRLIFINYRNQMEWWNIKEKKLVKRIECSPNVFNLIRFSKKILFMTTTNSEIILWDSESLGCLQKRKKAFEREIVKIETVNNDVFVLYSDGILEKWNFRKNDIKVSKITFPIKDFFIDKYLFLLGDVLIQVMEISKTF